MSPANNRRWFAPDCRIESVVQVDATYLAKHNRRGLLLDLDGTLIPHYATELTAQVKDWLDGLRLAGVQLAILSNGRPAHVARWSAVFDIPAFSRARKPLPFVCRQALHELGLSPSNSAILGDQLFTDILTGRWTGLHTILVRPFHSREPWHIRLRRPIERLLLGNLPSPDSVIAHDA